MTITKQTYIEHIYIYIYMGPYIHTFHQPRKTRNKKSIPQQKIKKTLPGLIVCPEIQVFPSEIGHDLVPARYLWLSLVVSLPWDTGVLIGSLTLIVTIHRKRCCHNLPISVATFTSCFFAIQETPRWRPRGTSSVHVDISLPPAQKSSLTQGQPTWMSFHGFLFKNNVELPSGKLTWPMKIPIFPGKYHQNCGCSMAMLVYRRVPSLKLI